MTKKVKGLLLSEEREVARCYREINKDGTKKYTQDELSSLFFVAPVTIRRALAEQGVLKLRGYKTRKEQALLDLLNKHEITTVSELEQLVQYVKEIEKVLDKHEIEDTKALDWALSGSEP